MGNLRHTIMGKSHANALQGREKEDERLEPPAKCPKER